jgi:hypothetical protein
MTVPKRISAVQTGAPCSCDSTQPSAVGTTSRNEPGAMPLWSAARCIRTGTAPLPATAPTSGLNRLAPAFLGGSVPKVTVRSACWQTALPRGYPDHSATWSGLSRGSSKPRACKRLPTPCARTMSRFRGRFVGRGAASSRSMPCWRACSRSYRNASWVVSQPSPRFDNGLLLSGFFLRCGKWPPCTSACSRLRLVSPPLG